MSAPSEYERQLWIALVAAFAASDRRDGPEICTRVADSFVAALSGHRMLEREISVGDVVRLKHGSQSKIEFQSMVIESLDARVGLTPVATCVFTGGSGVVERAAFAMASLESVR